MGKERLKYLSKFQFKKGSTPHNKGYKCQKNGIKRAEKPLPVRLNNDKFAQMVTFTNNDQTMQICDAQGKDSGILILRPRGREVQAIDSYTDEVPGSPECETYRLLHNKKTSELWNFAFRDHIEKQPTCKGSLDWDYSREQKRGLVWISSLQCSTCGYQSHHQKLYEEVTSTRPGRRAARLNVAMSLGRMGTSLTTEGMRGMLLTANIHPASASSMQDTANKVGEKISSVNRRSMTDIRKSLKEKNSECGLPVNSSIRAEGDARYNNSTFSALGKTPFQAGTQVTYTMCENVTSEKKIISVFCGNKLCKKGEYLRGKGEQVTCPGHTGCTANLTQQTNIGNEKQWAVECIEELNKDEDPLTISHLTTDGDSAASQGASIKQGKNIENLKDLRHFFESQRKETSKAPFGERMFPGRTKADRESAKKRFAQDLKTRCRSEYEKAHKYFGGDMQKLTNALSYAVDAIISCYRGECGKPCQRHSFACRGLKRNHWTSSVLPKDFKIKMSDSNQQLLRDCINLTLGRKSLSRIKFHTTTQKCESVNRAYLRSNSKCITYSRNFEPRIHRVIHTLGMWQFHCRTV